MVTSPTPPLSPIAVSPTHSYREGYRRRNSSFSSNHDRSPVTPRSKHRFSNASINSNDLPTPGEERSGGLGNLADELEDLDDEEYDEGITEDDIHEQRRERFEDDEETSAAVKEARDSGVDVSYNPATGSPSTTNHVRNFSKPFSSPSKGKKPPDGHEVEEEKLSHELEDLLNSIARMTNSASASSSTNQPSSSNAIEDPLVSRTIALLQDLGNQTTLEQSTTRLNTSTNSMTAHLASQSKSLQSLSTSLYIRPLGAAAAAVAARRAGAGGGGGGGYLALDPDTLEETLPLITEVLANLPHPDTAPLQGLQKLARETENVIQTLSQLTDTLQMGRQATSAAARHLRTTQTIVAELRRERERADDARLELGSDEARAWEAKVKDKWCKGQCEDIVSGFDSMCEDLRGKLAESAAAAAA